MCVIYYYNIYCIILSSRAHTTRGSGDCITADVSRGVHYITRIMHGPDRRYYFMYRAHCVALLLLFFGQFFRLFFLSLSDRNFSDQEPKQDAFAPPRRRGVARKPRTRHIRLSLGGRVGVPVPPIRLGATRLTSRGEAVY